MYMYIYLVGLGKSLTQLRVCEQQMLWSAHSRVTFVVRICDQTAFYELAEMVSNVQFKVSSNCRGMRYVLDSLLIS